MMDLEVQQHLKDCLFHGVCKHICDSVWYLYSIPRACYSQQMVVAHKAGCKKKEIWHKIRSRAEVATDPGEGMAEFGQQIAKNMAALTKTGQGNNPSSAPSSPLERGHGRGHNSGSTPNCPNSHNGRSGPGRLLLPTAYLLGVGHGTLGTEVLDRVMKGLAQEGRAQLIGGTQILANTLGARGEVTWPGMPYTSNSFKTSPGGTEGMQLTPCWQQLTQPTVGPSHFHPDPRQRPARRQPDVQAHEKPPQSSRF